MHFQTTLTSHHHQTPPSLKKKKTQQISPLIIFWISFVQENVWKYVRDCLLKCFFL
jgi:hypothetical protein